MNFRGHNYSSSTCVTFQSLQMSHLLILLLAKVTADAQWLKWGQKLIIRKIGTIKDDPPVSHQFCANRLSKYNDNIHCGPSMMEQPETSRKIVSINSFKYSIIDRPHGVEREILIGFATSSHYFQELQPLEISSATMF